MLDAHAHVWRLWQAGCIWPTADLAPIYHDFDIHDLAAIARPLGVNGVLLVQSQEDDADTAWLLQVAEQNDFVRGVVGWVNLAASGAAERIKALTAAHPKLCAVRPMLQAYAPDWLTTTRVANDVVAAMVGAGLAFDALVLAEHLPALAAFALVHPDLPIVINHAAKPTSGLPEKWCQSMTQLAAMPQVACKLSGLLTETPDFGDALATGRWVLEMFGAHRVMWGSDWPVVNLVTDYSLWLALAQSIVPAADHGAVFGGTAARIYRISAT